jgi:hypothetical protein
MGLQATAWTATAQDSPVTGAWHWRITATSGIRFIHASNQIKTPPAAGFGIIRQLLDDVIDSSP